jgi:hypothetical protein
LQRRRRAPRLEERRLAAVCWLLLEERAMAETRIPSFARDFPHAPELDALVDAFARGNYAEVRARAPGLAAGADDDRVREAARSLVEHTRPDPLAVAILALTAALLLALGGFWMVYGKAPTPGLPPAAAPR